MVWTLSKVKTQEDTWSGYKAQQPNQVFHQSASQGDYIHIPPTPK